MSIHPYLMGEYPLNSFEGFRLYILEPSIFRASKVMRTTSFPRLGSNRSHYSCRGGMWERNDYIEGIAATEKTSGREYIFLLDETSQEIRHVSQHLYSLCAIRYPIPSKSKSSLLWR